MAIKAFIDKLLPAQNWSLILLASVALLLVYLLNTALMAIVNYWGHALGVGIETDMRRQAFEHLQNLPFRYFDNMKTGHIITHVTKDLEEIGEVAHHGPEDLFLAIHAGETVAFVGPSGAGKTTLCSLLPPFLRFKRGCYHHRWN